MRYFFFSFPLILLLCKKPPVNQQDKKELLKTELRKFFDIPPDPKSNISGLFRVDGQSLGRSMEQKYLKGYKAQPDELSLDAIRNRMKNTTIFFRISQGGAIAMATITPGNVGVSQGVIKRQANHGELFTWLGKLRNRKGEISIKIMHKKSERGESFEYLEGDTRLEATREKRPAVELAKIYADIISQGTGLAEY